MRMGVGMVESECGCMDKRERGRVCVGEWMYMYMCVQMYVCACVCGHVCMCECVDVCTLLCL